MAMRWMVGAGSERALAIEDTEATRRLATASSTAMTLADGESSETVDRRAMHHLASDLPGGHRPTATAGARRSPLQSMECEGEAPGPAGLAPAHPNAAS